MKDGKVVITGLVDGFTGTSISIPDTIGTMPVEEIKDRAFYIKGVETLTLGNNIKKIGEYAFAGNNISDITFPDSVEEIGSSAFRDNILSNLNLNHIKKIDSEAFINNTINTLDLGSSLEEIGTGAFKNNNIKETSIPATLNTIGEDIFADNNRFVKVLNNSNNTNVGSSGSIPNIQKKEGGFGYVIDPITIKIKFIDKETGLELLNAITVGDDLASLNNVYVKGTEQTYKAPELQGYKLYTADGSTISSVNFTPNTDPFELTVEYIKKNEDITLKRKEKVIPMLRVGETDVENVLRSFIEAKNNTGRDLSSQVVINPTNIDTSIEGGVHEVFYTLRDEDSGEIKYLSIKVYVGTDMMKFPLGNDWVLGDFVYAGDRNVANNNVYEVSGLSASGIEKIKTNKELVLPHINPKTGDSITKVSSHNYDGNARFENKGITSISSFDGGISNIGWHAFYGNSDLTEINNMPNITKVEDSAFRDVRNLTKFDFSKVVSIGEWAFANTNVKNVVAPELIQLDFAAFHQGHVGSDPDFPDAIYMPKLERIGTHAFSGNDIKYIDQEKQFPNATTIGVNAFREMRNRALVSVKIPKISKVESGAFSWNWSIKELYAPELVTIGDNAFSVNYIDNIDLPKAVTIETSAFWHNDAKTLSIPEAQTIGNSAFQENKLVELNLPKVQTIGIEAFKNNLITTVTAPVIRRIDKWAFWNDNNVDGNRDGAPDQNPGLKILGYNIPIYTNNTNLVSRENYIINPVEESAGEYTDDDFIWDENVDTKVLGFTTKGKAKLISNDFELKLPDKVTEVGDNAFNFEKIRVIIGKNVRIVGKEAFQRNRIEILDMPKLEEVKELAFADSNASDDKRIKSLNLPKLKKLDSRAFNSLGVENVDMPEIEEISEGAFSNNYITKVSAPKLKKVGARAFQNNRFTEISKEMFPVLEHIEYTAFADQGIIEKIDLPTLKYSFGVEEFKFGYWNRNKPAIWVVPEGIKNNGNNKKSFGDNTFNVIFNSDKTREWGDWNIAEPGGIILTAPVRADGTLDRTNPDGWLESIKTADFWAKNVAVKGKYRTAIINPSTVKVNYKLEDGSDLDGINGRPNLPGFREFIYEEQDRNLQNGSFKTARTYSAPNVDGYVLVSTTDATGNVSTTNKTIDVPYEAEGNRTDREITFTYRKIEKSKLPGPVLKYGIGENNSTKIVGQDGEYIANNGSMPQMLTRFDISNVLKTIKKGKIKISFDKPYINPKSIVLSNSAATSTWYAENNFVASDSGMEITLNDNIAAGSSLNAAISYKFKSGVTPDGVNVGLKMILIDENDQSVYEIVSEAENVNLKLAHRPKPLLKVHYANNLSGYNYNGSYDYQNNPRDLGKLIEKNDKKVVTDNPEFREFYYTVENVYYNMSGISLRTSLPTYKAMEADGSIVEKTAVFEPALNPEWTLSSDNKSLTFNKSLAVPTRDKEILNRKIPSLKLKFPGAVEKEEIKNDAYLYLTPAKDFRDASVYKDVAAIGNLGEGATLSVWPLYVPILPVSFEDVGGGKSNGGTPRSSNGTAYLYDNAEDKKKDITYRLSVSATNELSDFKNVSIIDYDLDNRLKYKALRFDNNPKEATGVSVLGYKKVGNNINTGADALVFEREAQINANTILAFGDTNIDYLQIKILGTDEKPFNDSLAFTVITGLKDENAALFDEIDSSRNSLLNKAMILGNRYQKGTNTEKSNKGTDEKYENIRENFVLDNTAKVLIYKYKSYVGLEKKLVYEANTDAYPVYPSIESGEVVLEGQKGAYHLRLKSGVEGNPYDRAVDVLENFELIDILPEAIDVEKENIILNPTFIRNGGKFEIISEYNTIENGANVKRTAIKFSAAKLDLATYKDQSLDIASITTKYLGTTIENILINKAYATWDNKGVEAMSPAKNTVGNNIKPDGNEQDGTKNPYTYADVGIKVVRSSALVGQLYIRNKTDNVWQEDIPTKSDEKFDYKMVISNYDNSEERTAYEGLDIINVLPAINDQKLNKQGARGTEFENKVDLTRLSDIKVPTGYSISYYNTTTPIEDILAGNKNMDDIGNDNAINWENEPSTDTKMIRIKANAGVSLAKGEKIEIEIPMVAPHIDSLNDTKINKRAVDSYVFRHYENNSTTYTKFAEPNRVYNYMEAPNGSISFTKYAKEGRLLDNNTATPLAGAGFELLDRDDNKKLLAIAYSDTNGLVKFDNLLTTKNYQIREFLAPNTYLLNTYEYNFGKDNFSRVENNNYNIVISEADSKNMFMNLKDIKGSITITKTARDENYILSNIPFRIRGTDATNNTFDLSTTTDENGQIVLTDLSEGNYRIEEIESTAINRYQKVSVQNIRVKADALNHNIKIKNENFQVLLRKIVSTNDIQINPENWNELTDFQKKKLPGYRFKVVGENGSTFTTNNTDNNGNVILQNLKTEVVYTVTELPIAQQTYNNKDLYSFNTNEYKFKITHDGKLMHIKADGTAVRFKQYALNIPNKLKKVKGKIVVKKVDKDNNAKSLVGAKIDIYKVDIVDGNTNLTKIGDTKTTAMVGSDAIVTFDSLEPGNYQIKEIEPPLGYILNTVPIEVNIPKEAPEGNNVSFDKSGDDIIYTVNQVLTNKASKVKGLKGSDIPGHKNMPISAAKIYIDSNKNTHPNYKYRVIGSSFATVYEPVAGASFELYEMKDGIKSGNAIAIDSTNPTNTTIISGADGSIDFGDYKFDFNKEYGVFETATVDGYELNTGYKTFKLSDEAAKPGFNGEYDFYMNNEASRGEISISKYDSVEKRNLAGVRFNIYKGTKATADFNKVHRSVVTGNDGIAYFPRLSFGNYVVREISAPNGYKTPSVDDDIEVTLSEATPIFKKKVFNTKLIDINIRKVWQKGSEGNVKVKLLRSTGKDVADSGRPLVIPNFTDENGLVTLDRSNNWTVTYPQLDMADKNGNVYYFAPVEEEITDAEYENIITGTKETGFTITNTAKKEASIGVTKEWDIVGSNEAPEGSSVTVALKRVKTGGILPAAGDVTETLQTYVLNADNNWQHTFEHLPLREWGENIIYRVEEVGSVQGFKEAVYTYDASSKNMTIKNVSVTRDIDVEKKWINVDPTNAPEVSIQVFDSENMNAPLKSEVPTLEAVSGKYIAKFTNIPSYAYTVNEDGSISARKIKYVLKEVYADGQVRAGYTTSDDMAGKYDTYSLDENMSSKVEVVMTNTLETENINISKIWSGIEAANAPEVSLQLVSRKDGTDTDVGSPIVLNNTVGWSKTLINLPKYEADGITEIRYDIKELNAKDGYTLSKTQTVDEDGNINISLTNTRKVVSASISKTWDMVASLYLGENISKPEVRLHLWADTTDNNIYDASEINTDTNGNDLLPLVLNETNNYRLRLESLPKYTTDGQTLIKYYVTEEAITGFNSPTDPVELLETELASDELRANIQNIQEKYDINVEKIWEGLEKYEENERVNTPEIHMDLYTVGADGSKKPVTGRTATLVRDTANTNLWNASFTNLPKYDVNGNEIIYKVVERENPAGYDVAYSEPEVVDVTNKKIVVTNTVKTVNVVANKNWVGKTEDSVEVKLFRDNTLRATQVISANADGLYTHTFADLPMYKVDGSTAYNYTLSETPINGYETAIREVVQAVDNGTKTFEITNTYMTVDIKVEKNFEGVEEANRPEVKLQLVDETDPDNKIVLANKILTLNRENNFRGVLEDLPKFKDDGTTLIKYNLVESPILAGYDFNTNATFSAVAQENSPYGAWTIIATNVRKTEDLIVRKKWASDIGGYTRPDVKLELLADSTNDGVDNPKSLGTSVVNADTDWKLTKTVPKYAADGVTLIKYYVKELPINGYNSVEGNIELSEAGTLATADKTGTTLSIDTSETTDIPSVANNTKTILKAELSNSLKVVDVNVEKTWEGIDKYVSKTNLPSIHVQLKDATNPMAKINVASPKELIADNGVYKASFRNLPKYKQDGTTLIDYEVEEVEDATLSGYSASYVREVSADGNTKIAITNKVETVKFKVDKSWVGVENNEAPEVRFNIIDRGVGENATSDINLTNKTIALNLANNFTQTIVDLPKYHIDGTTLVDYGINEVTDLAGYSFTYSKNVTAEGISLVATNTRVNIPVKLKKIWANDNVGYTRPELTFEIFANAVADDSNNAVKVKEVQLNADNNFEISLDLPKYASNGTDEIHYYVQEVVPNGYKSDDGRKALVFDRGVLKAELTNKLILRDILISQEWKDLELYKNSVRGNVPNLHVEIYDITDGIAGAKKVGVSKILVKDTDGLYKTKYEKLPKYKEDGVTEIKYMVKELEENNLVGYKVNYKTPIVDNNDNLVLNIENNPVKVEIKVKKTWRGVSPDLAPEVRLALIDSTATKDVDLAGKVISLNVGNNFASSFGDLPKYNIDGTTPINYTLKEQGTKKGYTFTQAKREGLAVELEGINERVTLSANLTKTWLDDDTDYVRPTVYYKLYVGDTMESATQVSTLADGSPIGNISLSKASNWTAVVNGLPKYDIDGDTLLKYYAEEVPISGYKSKGRQELILAEDGLFGADIENELLTTNVRVEQSFRGLDRYTDENLDKLPSIEVCLYDITDPLNPIKIERSTKTLTKSSDSKWTTEYKKLPKYKEDGVSEIKYSIGNISTYDGYEQSEVNIEKTNTGDTFISFTETAKMTKLYVKKTWIGVEKSKAPEIEVKLLDRDKLDDIKDIGSVKKLNQDNDFEYEYSVLPKYHIDGKTPVRYEFEEISKKDGYIFKEDKYEILGDTIKVAISNTRVSLDMKLRKLWEKDNSSYVRPAVSFTLYKKEGSNYTAVGFEKDGVEHNKITIDASMNFVADIHGLPKYDESGDKLIEYYIKEDALKGYIVPKDYIKAEVTDDGSLYAEAENILEKRTVKAIKHWKGLESYSEEDIRNLAKVHAVLYDITDEKTKVAEVEFIKDESGEYSAVFSDVPKYKIDGVTPIIYDVEELEAGRLEGFTTAYLGSKEDSAGNLSFDIENSLITGKVSVKKTWRTPPFLVDSVNVYLTKGGKKVGESVTLNADMNWEYTFKNIPIYEADGITKIKYSVKEEEVFAYQTYLKKSEEDENTFELYNIYTGIVKDGKKSSFSVVNRFGANKLEPQIQETIYEKKIDVATPDIPERVKEKVLSLIPKTGDNESILIYVGLVVLSSILLILVLMLRKKEDR